MGMFLMLQKEEYCSHDLPILIEDPKLNSSET